MPSTPCLAISIRAPSTSTASSNGRAAATASRACARTVRASQATISATATAPASSSASSGGSAGRSGVASSAPADDQASDAGDAQPTKLESDFDFAAAQQEAESAFAATSTCGGGSRHPLADRVYLLEEKERPGQLMPIMEDEHGTYIMNSKDLRAVEHVARLTQIGVDSLKIEGRTKSLYYVARTAQVYRRAIDDAVAGRPFNPELLIELEGLSNRGYTGGLLERRPSNDYQNYISGHSVTQRSQYVGEVLGTEGIAEAGLSGDWVLVETKNHFAVGDLIEVVHPSGNTQVRLDQMRNVEGQPVQVAQGSPVRVWIPLPARYSGALLARVIESQPPAAAAEPALAV